MSPEKEMQSLLNQYDLDHAGVNTEQNPADINTDPDHTDQKIPEPDDPQNVPTNEPQGDINQRFQTIEHEHEILKHERQALIDQQDYDRSLSYAKYRLKEDHPDIPDGMLDRYLRAEALINPRLNDAWNNRYNGPGGTDRLERALKRAVCQYAEEFKTMPDPKLTSDRNTVTAAMKAASTYRHIDTKESPDFGKMNKQQLDEYLNNHG